MRFDDQRESDNIEDQRGSGGGGFNLGGGGFGGGGLLPGLIGMLLGGRSLGCGGILIIGAILLFAGGGLGSLGGLLGGGGGAPAGPEAQVEQPQIGFPGAETQPAVDTARPATADATDRFVRQVLGSTEDVWDKVFPAQIGRAYPQPTLVLFSGRGQSGCGTADAAMGPFYCPADRKLYLDQGFFDELANRFNAGGDAAAAYVIAHEVGHHIQTVLGISDQVQAAQSRAGESQRNALQVRMELQADCLAGVWAKTSGRLEAGDIEEAVRAAQAIGDDTLQRQSRGTVVPDSFTHGSSAQRVEWLRKGLSGGSIEQCDTFASGAV